MANVDDYDDLKLIFDESGCTEEFLGFSGNEIPPDEDSKGSIINNSDSDSDDSSVFDSEDDECTYEEIKRRQEKKLGKKKNMLNMLVNQLDTDPVFRQMKNGRKRNARVFNKRLFIPSLSPVTRLRSKGNGDYQHESLTHQPFTVKLFSKKRPSSPEKGSTPKRRCYSTKAQPHIVVPVEDITPNMIANIAQHSTGKTYDIMNGSSCHQCRQKTRDTKSCCRAPDCVGVRGQFCGPCLQNRYGESVKEALMDPDWQCPVCRGFCNCSICRNRSGKCATGILIGLARQNGHDNVKDYLTKLGDNDDD